ncbi:flagellar hook-basal body complex protein FliE [Agrobacterium rubi TR3 = NBRC 13261]|uniref:Flagellar hook-basal body complex protein FliE n=1 Tax=Agrobacterium rubi TR3 = NBRC 13261 TaxID=1368415 RepID=A0A081CU54_9HYPH|nr:flagellar hook-basal body complex protein FliE [Agrobacterium rubi]MBP1879052.1 flagellar hook-basal body complex protein FliE [Agrobacterium rubi]MCL6652372.1 flagellar hook-basal body protein FliE [Agrobacterium rubi]GAK70200.1 flagellar hook-basal body complex protein FliE [Agrobacterium rubi TR3 = NBRC 13261]
MIDAISSLKSLTSSSTLDGVKDVTSSLTSLAGSAVSTAATAASGPTFGSVLGSVASDAVESLKKGEAMSFAGIQGKANTREVVDAVMQADQTLKTAVALRDKIVSAYLDIVKMQI